jgi:hypothetical protein
MMDSPTVFSEAMENASSSAHRAASRNKYQGLASLEIICEIQDFIMAPKDNLDMPHWHVVRSAMLPQHKLFLDLR